MGHRSRAGLRALLVLLAVASCALVGWSGGDFQRDSRPPPDSKGRGFRPVQKLLDLSGLAWMGGSTFLAVHDAKVGKESDRVRVSLIQLPASLDGLQWKPQRVRFPGRKSNDLESASRIPGTRKALLVESGNDASALDRIYLAWVGRRRVRILDAVEWSSFYEDYHNVEGTAVAETETGHLFIWAERNDGGDSTLIRWTDLRLSPFEIGAEGFMGSALFSLPEELAERYNRPLVGMDVDESGEIYIVTAFDSGSDDGPFSSAVLRIGAVVGETVVLDVEPTVVGVLDGFKVESVSLRSDGETRGLFVGTDDENYGGTLRPLFLDF